MNDNYVEANTMNQVRGLLPAAGERPVRVLVVDNDPTMVQMLTIALSYEGFDVTVASDGPDVIRKAYSTKPNLLLLDWMMPNIDVIDLSRKLKAASGIGILMLRSRIDGLDQDVSLESDFDDYLFKPFTVPVLLDRVRAILRRMGINLQSTLRAGDIMLDRLTRRVERGERQIELTPREFDLLEMLLSHPRQVFSREAILNQVWGYNSYVETNVVDVYICYLRDKLSDQERRLIRSVRGVGYALDPSNAP